MIDALTHCAKCGLELGAAYSPRAHRYLHVILNVALANWPDNHPDIQPRNATQLKAWLLCTDRVDFFDAIAPATPRDFARYDQAIPYYQGHMTRLRDAGGYSFLYETNGGGVELRFPRSPSQLGKGAGGKRAFSALVNRMVDEIVANTGLAHEVLKARASRDLMPRKIGQYASAN